MNYLRNPKAPTSKGQYLAQLREQQRNLVPTEHRVARCNVASIAAYGVFVGKATPNKAKGEDQLLRRWLADCEGLRAVVGRVSLQQEEVFISLVEAV